MISVRGVTFSAAVLLALAVSLPPSAQADQWNQKTSITFSAPVEIPGQVLTPGTYVFKLVDLLGDRHVVQIFDKDEKHLYGTILAITDYRLKPRGKTIVTFEERAAGAPQAIKAWFYPGENFGHEFVYPKTTAVELAQANNTAVPSMSEENTTTTTQSQQALEQAPLMAQQPNQQEVAVTEAFTPPPVQAEPAPPPPPPPAPAAAEPEPVESLPQTASPLPLIGLLGVLSLGVAGLLRLAAARMS